VKLCVGFFILVFTTAGKAQAPAGEQNPLGRNQAPLGFTVQAKVNANDGLKYAWIPPGTFMMGCSPGDSACGGNEKPAHQVTLSKGLWLGQTEVTVGAYKRFTRESGKGMPTEPDFMGRALNSGWANDAMPIVNVSWDDATAYCSWAGGRLPTEAEWEYAARAGCTEARYGPPDEIAWYADNSGEARIDSARIWNEKEQSKYAERLRDNGNRMRGAAQKRANGFGLFDMLGNVWEWVSDWYGEKYYQGSPERDPPGATSSEHRVLRGGSWVNSADGMRLSLRVMSKPGVGSVNLGFRCVREVIP